MITLTRGGGHGNRTRTAFTRICFQDRRRKPTSTYPPKCSARLRAPFDLLATVEIFATRTLSVELQSNCWNWHQPSAAEGTGIEPALLLHRRSFQDRTTNQYSTTFHFVDLLLLKAHHNQSSCVGNGNRRPLLQVFVRLLTALSCRARLCWGLRGAQLPRGEQLL